MNLKDNFLLRVQEITNTNPLSKKRDRHIVEVRALLIYLLHSILGMGCSSIRDYLFTKGFKTHHATILHAIKNWDIYSKYNPQLMSWCNEILITSDFATDEIKLEYIKDKMQFLPNADLQNIYIKIQEHYDTHIQKMCLEQETKFIENQSTDNS